MHAIIARVVNPEINMMAERIFWILTILGISVTCAGLVVGALWRMLRPKTMRAEGQGQREDPAPVFLFEGGHLADATPAA